MSEVKERSKKKQVSDLKFPRLKFVLDELAGCCGVGVACNFVEESTTRDYFTGKYVEPNLRYKSKEEQAEACAHEIHEECRNNGYAVAVVTLVWKYSNTDGPQEPHLHDALLKMGYNIDREWFAPRHGNTLRMYSAYFDDVEDDNDW